MFSLEIRSCLKEGSMFLWNGIYNTHGGVLLLVKPADACKFTAVWPNNKMCLC